MKVLTTDLDRTFIYSERTVNNGKHPLICIEYLDGKPISFVTPKVIEQLDNIQEEQLLIPVTTRSLQQYERIHLFPKYYAPSYAIVANGGIVIKDGQRDLAWDTYICEQFSNIVSFQQLPIQCQELFSHKMFRKITNANELFYILMIVEPLKDDRVLQEIESTLQLFGWTSYVNGRKFYVLPKFLTKERAVKYVLQQLSYELHWAAGDSVMDQGMLEIAHTGFTPKHGTLFEEQLPAHIKKCATEGIEFTETLMDEFLTV